MRSASSHALPPKIKRARRNFCEPGRARLHKLAKTRDSFQSTASQAAEKLWFWVEQPFSAAIKLGFLRATWCASWLSDFLCEPLCDPLWLSPREAGASRRPADFLC